MGEGEVGEVFSLEEEGGSAWMLLDWGASVVSVVVQTPNKNHAELTVGFSDFARYRQGHPYFGSTVGRVAGRISQARFKIGDRWFSLDRNEGACHLHGGAQGFAWKRWKSGIVSTAYGDGIRFERESPSGEGGYPGNLTVAVTYTLIDPWTLSAVFSAESDALTPVNMTNHAYWNLSGEETVARHELRLFTRDFLEAGPDLIPTGNRIPMAGSRLDFTVSRPLGEIIAESGGCDICFIDPVESVYAPQAISGVTGRARPLARLFHPETRRGLEVHATLPALQVYTGNFLDGSLVGRDGRPILKHGAVCLEPQYPPDAPNRPEFPSILIGPGKEYREEIIYHLTLA